MATWTTLRQPFRPFAHRDFRRLWLASTAAMFGFWMHRVSVGWLMSSMSPSPALIASMESLYFLPALLVSIPAGIVADFVNRARYLVAVLAGIFAVQVVLATFVGTGAVTPAVLLSVTFLLGLGTALRNPALDTELGRCVPPEELRQAFALDGVSFNLARIAGPPAAGAMLEWLGLVYPFVFAAASTLGLVAVFLTWQAAPPRTFQLATIRGEVQAGFRAILANRSFRSVGVRAVHFYFCCNIFWALLLVARNRLHLDAQGYGLLYTCFGVGAVAGGLLYSAFGHELSNNSAINVAAAGYAAMLLSLAQSDNLVFLAIMLAVGGASMTVVTACLSAATLALFGDDVKSRAMALFYVAGSGSIAVGTPIWGALAQWSSVESALRVIAAFMLAGILATPLWNIAEVEMRPEEITVEA